MMKKIVRFIIPIAIIGISTFSGLVPSISDVSTFAAKEAMLIVPDVENVRMTAYSSRHCETDDTPFITSTGDSVEWGIVAFSRDLLNKYGYGSLVYIEGLGLFRVSDTMHRRKKSHIDIWFPETEDAKNFGVQNLRVFIFPSQGKEWIENPI